MSFRIEQKLQISPDMMPLLVNWISENDGVTLFPERTINSIYFDTDDLQMYNDSNEGNLPRKKIRIRCYDNCDHVAGSHMLETKISSVEGRFKDSKPVKDIYRLLEMGHFDSSYGSTRPLLTVNYDREYFTIHGIRLTVDRNIKFSAFTGITETNFFLHDERIAVELKAADKTSIDYLMNKFPFPRIRFSKYAYAVEALSLNTNAM